MRSRRGMSKFLGDGTLSERGSSLSDTNAPGLVPGVQLLQPRRHATSMSSDKQESSAEAAEPLGQAQGRKERQCVITNLIV